MSANEAYLSAIQSLLNVFLPSVQMLAVRAQIVCIAQHTRDSIIMVRPADIAPTLPELMELGHDRPLAAARRVRGRFAAARQPGVDLRSRRNSLNNQPKN